MKVSLIGAALAAFTAFPAATHGALIRTGGASQENSHVEITLDENERALVASTVCKGPTLVAGERLEGGESICAMVAGEMVYYGVRTYANNPEPGYTKYQLEIWSPNGTHDRQFLGVGTTGVAPFLQLQMDGHLVFADNSATGDCLAKPGTRGPAMTATIEGPLPDLLKVRDNNGDIVWTLSQTTLSNGQIIVAGSQCYPQTPRKCVSALKEQERLTWNEYVCEYDSSGKAAVRFGLDEHGLLGLWENSQSEPIWRPGPGHVRGDYLHLQGDGHLTLYRETTSSPNYTWVSQCRGNDSKIAVSGGNVHQFNGDGSVSWTLRTEEASLEPVCFRGCA